MANALQRTFLAHVACRLDVDRDAIATPSKTIKGGKTTGEI